MSDKEKNKKTPLVKVLKVCWGCNRKEEKGQAPFRNCSKCVELKVLPSLFCSNECLRENWPRHKAWHKELTSSVDAVQWCRGTEEGIEIMKKMSDEQDTNTTNGIYAKLCIDGNKLMHSMNFDEARRKFRKAQKLDPRLPDAYGYIGCLYAVSRQFEEAMTSMEGGVERWAFVAVTGKYGDGDFDVAFGSIQLKTKAAQQQWAIGQFVEILYSLLDQFTSRQEGLARKKPNWYRRDAVLKRVTRFLVGALCESLSATKKICGQDETGVLNKLIMAQTWHAHVLAGSIKNGVLDASNNGLLDANISVCTDLPKDRTMEDLEEAAASFNAAAIIEEDYAKLVLARHGLNTAGDKEMFQAYAASVTWNAERMKAGLSQNKSPFYEGCWVVVFGLTSSAGQSLNKKLGLVTNANQNQGRLTVQIDGLDEPKSLKTQNLMVIPMDDKDVALISCLPDKSQWTCMKPTLKKHLHRIPDS